METDFSAIYEIMDAATDRELELIIGELRQQCAKRGLMGQYNKTAPGYDKDDKLYQHLFGATRELEQRVRYGSSSHPA